MSDGIWTQFIADVKRGEDMPQNTYPQSLAEIRRLWLPPQSVIAFLTKVAQEKGISDEAATWLHRVTVARQLDTQENRHVRD